MRIVKDGDWIECEKPYPTFGDLVPDVQTSKGEPLRVKDIAHSFMNSVLRFRVFVSPADQLYPPRTPEDLADADLKRELNSAYDRIEKLSRALVDLGYDPTQI